MKKKIAIIGAGQAGLVLAHALQAANISVTLFSDKSPNDLKNGPVLSTQCLFYSTLAIEKEFNLDDFALIAPQNKQTTLTISSLEQTKPLVLNSHLKGPYQSVDQRLKFSHWLARFIQRGGHCVIQPVTLADLENITEQFDLTIIASGKTSLAQCFKRHETYSPHTSPQRTLSCFYVQGLNTSAENNQGSRISILQEVGEFIVMPAYTLSGPCHILGFEALPNGIFDQITFQDKHLALKAALNNIQCYFPWEQNLDPASIGLTDEKAWIKGAITPTVRHPIAYTPHNKRPLLGLADAILLNDPLAAQGANQATKAAYHYFQRILAHPSNIFDEEWMAETYESYWQNHGYAAWRWSNFLLQSPLPTYFLEFITFASRYPALADRYAEGFNDPSTLLGWLYEEDATQEVIAAAINSG